MCGIICAKLCGMENDDIKNAIVSFRAPEHRLEKVREMVAELTSKYPLK